MAASEQAAVITITVEKDEQGRLTSQHKVHGLSELVAAAILLDIGRDIFLAHLREHEHAQPVKSEP